ncbi:MAG: hypothetical protein K2Y23_21845 [Cyanobacteria bacterium]|nr:hypothetical protein [Cyanobacteriota bacterium]
MRSIATVVALMFVLVGASKADAQCGSFEMEYGGYWNPTLDRAGGYSITSRSEAWAAICNGDVRGEVWLSNYGGYNVGDGYTRGHGIYEVEPSYTGTHTANTKHWWISPTSQYYLLLNGLDNFWAEHTCNPPPGGCPIEGSVWDPVACQCTEGCPLLLDTEANGFRLTSRDDGVYFDLNSDGTPELISWTEANSDDGWLVMDRNGNGRIDNGRELFGNFSSIYQDALFPIATDGFQALRALENNPSWGVSRRDSAINGHDASYSSLQVWRDLDHDGATDEGELTALPSLGVVSLDLNYKTSRQRDEHGNFFRLKAPSDWQLPDGKIKKRIFWDVYLLIQ